MHEAKLQFYFFNEEDDIYVSWKVSLLTELMHSTY